MDAKRAPRAAIYTRLSRDRDGSTAIDRQLEACRRFCQSRGYEIVHESTVDVDVSGGKLVRPGLDEVRGLLPELDVIVFWRLDRLSRSLRDFLGLVSEAEEHGVALVSATEPLDLTTPIGRAMVSVLAVFAQLERETVGIRAANTIGHLRRVGRVSGGRQPYGFRARPAPDGQGYIRATDDAEAAVVLEMIDGILSGRSRLQVATALNDRGVPAPKGGAHWSPKAVSDILRNPALWGAVVHHGLVVRDDDGLPLLTDAVVSRDDWETVQSALDARSTYADRMSGRRTALLSGLLLCAECGTRMGLGAGSGPHRSYRCPAKGRGGPCPGVSVSAARLEEFVVGRFLEKYGPWSMRNVDWAAEAETADAGDGASAAEEALRDVDTALGDLERDRYELGLFGDDAGLQRYARMHRRLSERRARLLAEQQAGETRRASAASIPASAQEPAGTTIAAWWGEASVSVEDRRMMLRGLLGHVAISKGQRGPRGLDPRRVSFGKGLPSDVGG